MEIVPLNVISTYSLLQSPLRPTELVQGAKSRGYRAVALADWNVMYGAFAGVAAAFENHGNDHAGLGSFVFGPYAGWLR